MHCLHCHPWPLSDSHSDFLIYTFPVCFLNHVIAIDEWMQQSSQMYLWEITKWSPFGMTPALNSSLYLFVLLMSCDSEKLCESCEPSLGFVIKLFPQWKIFPCLMQYSGVEIRCSTGTRRTPTRLCPLVHVVHCVAVLISLTLGCVAPSSYIHHNSTLYSGLHKWLWISDNYTSKRDIHCLNPKQARQEGRFVFE